MKEHIKAIQQKLAELGWPTPYGDATGVDVYPYTLLWSSVGSDDVEPTLSADGAWSDLIGATTVDTSGMNVLVTTNQIRALLDGAALEVDGRHARLYLQRSLSQSVTVDRSVTITATNTHPCFAVDRYLLVSQPA